jgi:hypothetical protein
MTLTSTIRGFLMPRRNKPKREPQTHVATLFDMNFKPDCYGCPFAGRDFICTTSDGTCLKIKLERREGGHVKVK